MVVTVTLGLIVTSLTVIPMLVAVFIYIGYNVFQFILSGEAISVIFPGGKILTGRDRRRIPQGFHLVVRRLNRGILALHHFPDRRGQLGDGRQQGELLIDGTVGDDRGRYRQFFVREDALRRLLLLQTTI